MALDNPSIGENLLNLDDISESNVLSVIEERFNKRRIYTNVGDVLLAINPFEEYKIYDDSVIAQYQQSNKYAHIFTPARCAVANIQSGSSSEIIVFSGESNSGKSFNAFQVMKYLVTSPNSRITVKQIEAIKNIFNSFGCAKTVKNDDATRFGYCVDFLYHKSRVAGLNVSTVLPLETIRVVSQRAGERNFNVFYELCAGLSSDIKASYGIRDQQKFFYLTQGKVGEAAKEDSARFERLDSALKIVGFSDEQRQIIYKTLASILHLGNMYFMERRSSENDSVDVKVGNDVELKWVSYLLDVDMNDFAPCFTHKITKTDEGYTRTAYSVGQALDARDALAMTLYEVLFSWITNRISLHLKCTDHNAVISVTDCYGIERYNNNGLEQLLINSVSEKLENTFVKQTFLKEIANYADEGLVFDWKVPPTLENDKVVDLLCKKPYGLLYLIDDECKFPKTSDESYLRHCNLNHLDKSVYGKAKNKEKLLMSVRHSFGTTWYNVHGFVQRNKRSLSNKMATVLARSQNPVIAMLFRNIAGGRNNLDHTVYAAYELNTSSTALMNKIMSAHPHFVRCMKSNNERVPARLDKPSLARQMNTFSVLETLQFRQIGFPVQMSFKRFTQSYRCLLPSDIALCQNQKEIIVDILDGQGVRFANDFRIGANYVFLRNRLADQLQTTAEKIQREAAYVIQKTMRMYITRKNYLRMRQAAILIQAGVRGWNARRKCSMLREQMLNSLSNQTTRNRRLSVYHEVLNNHSSNQTCSSALIGCLDLENTGWKEFESSSRGSKSNAENMKTTADYLPSKLKNRIGTVEPLSIEDFALQYFKGHLLGFRREPILTPFLHKENLTDERLSLEVFKLILKYMHDQTLSREQLDDLGRYIMKQGINNPCQRDEIFVQLCNQIYRNPDKAAQSRCLRLLLHAVGLFAASKMVLPMLISFCDQQRPPIRGMLLNTISRRMGISNYEISRLLPASHLEMGAIYAHRNAAVEVTCQDCQTYVVETHSWITSEDVVNEVLRHRGVGNPIGWSVEVQMDKTLYYPTGAHFLHDVIAEIELGKEENKMLVLFFNYPIERTLPSVNTKNMELQSGSTQAKMSPVVRRHLRQMFNSSRELSRSLDTMNTRRSASRRDSRANSTMPKLCSESYRGVFDEHESHNCCTLPVNKPSFKVFRSQQGSGNVYHDCSGDIPPCLSRQLATTNVVGKFEPSVNQISPQLCHRYNDKHEKTNEVVHADLTSQYYATTPVPVVQYVPVIVPPQSTIISNHMNQTIVPQPVLVQTSNISNRTHCQPHLIGQGIIQQPHVHQQLQAPHPHYLVQSSQIHSKTSSEDQTRDFDPVKSVRQPEFDSIRSHSSVATRGDHCDSRILNSRSDYVPSVHSTVSVASQIRNMPLPNSNRDVDRFLDEVFDQVLSPHELTVEMNPQDIAASIKGGGGYGPTSYASRPYHEGVPIYQHGYSGNGCYQYGEEAGHYHHFGRENMGMTGVSRMDRSRSLPRYFVVSSEPVLSHRNFQEGSVGSYPPSICPVREYVPQPTQCTPIVQLSSNNQATVQCAPQQMVFMMPLQMNPPVGQMMPVLMTPGMVTPTITPNMQNYAQPNTPMTEASPMQRRHHSFDASFTITGDVSPHQSHVVTNSSPSTHSSRQGTIRTSKSMSVLVKPDQPGAMPRPLPRSGPAVISPVLDRRLNGLNRVSQQLYREPVVQNTMINSEHPNPQKFRTAEKNLVKGIQQKEQEAIQKITERLKNLPPPVDQVRVFTRKKNVTLPTGQIWRVPEEPRQICITRRHNNTNQIQNQRPETEWVHESDVEHSAELERTRSAGTSLIIESQRYDSDSVSSQQNPTVKYVKQPWKLVIRKEMFRPDEVLDDVTVIDQVFAQIVSDCRKGIAYRIRSYEKDEVAGILEANHIPPELLDKQEEIPIPVKIEVISAARKWPLYFMQAFEVVEERSNESISLLLCISEHGIRLIQHTSLDNDSPLKVLDHFEFSDLLLIALKSDSLLQLHTKNGIIISLRTKMAAQIKDRIDKCMFGQIQPKQFVRATSDYITKRANLLSFRKGDTIEIVPLPANEEPPPESWLYGKIGNRYGSLPAHYVVPLDENNREIEESTPPPPPMYGDTVNDDSKTNGCKYSMLEFALNNFRGPKGFENTLKRNNKQWTWNDIAQKIKFTDKPISHSLLRFDSNEMDKMACETFLCIMRYMGDEPIPRGETITDSVYRLLLLCHKNSALHDEVYCQIIRQTTNNKSSKPESLVRGWRLFSILTAYFDCSFSLKPYLTSYLTENADDQRRAYYGTAQLCLRNLRQTVRYGGRKYLLSGMEVEEITNGKIFKRQAYVLPGGLKKVVNTKSVTVVEEAIRELCLQLNIRSPSEQQEFCLTCVIEKENRIEYCKNNDYILDICAEYEHRRQDFHFLLKRCTWVHPLRLDDPLYIDVMFFQVVPDYLLGSFLTKHICGQMSASTCDDIVKLAAYLHLGAKEGRRINVTPRTVLSLMPSTVQDEYPSHSVDTWAYRVCRQLRSMDAKITRTQARTAFLDVLSAWPLFGNTLFKLDTVSCDGQSLPQLELAVGKTGLKLLRPETHEIVEQWSYDKIVSMKTDDQGSAVMMVVGTSASHRTYEFHTNESSSITRLVGQYIFIVNQSRGLLPD